MMDKTQQKLSKGSAAKKGLGTTALILSLCNPSDRDRRDRHAGAEWPDLVPKLVRLAPKGTKPEFFEKIFQYILAQNYNNINNYSGFSLFLSV